MIVYGTQKRMPSVEKEVLSVLETVRSSELKGKISFVVASCSFTPNRGQDREIDFVFVGSAGIYVLEVKGGEISIEDGIWYTKDHWGSQHKIDPFGQAKSNFYGLWRFLQSRGVALEQNPLGHYACAFPEYKLNKAPDTAWDIEQYFDTGFMLNPRKYVSRLIAYTQNRFGGHRSLSDNTQEKIKEILVPNYKDYIRDISSAVDEKVLLLSEEQNIAFDALAAVKRMVVEGPPGSGKTILAVEQLVENEKAGVKTLYVCFNRAIRNKVAFDVTARLNHKPKYVHVTTTTMLSVDHDKYDYLILDEAQDYLNNDEIKTLEGYLNGGFISGRFRIYIDLNQDTFGRSERSTLEQLIKRDDVVLYPLKYNYRNSASINAYIRKMTPLRVGKVRRNPLGIEPEIHKIPYKGINVDYSKYPQEVVGKINELLKSGVAPREIMVVSISKHSTSVMSERNRKNTKLKDGVTFTLVRDVEWEKFEKSNSIINGNAYDLKGLDSKVVICTDVFSKEDKEEALLVGMTRARSRLIVFTGKNIK